MSANGNDCYLWLLEKGRCAILPRIARMSRQFATGQSPILANGRPGYGALRTAEQESARQTGSASNE